MDQQPVPAWLAASWERLWVINNHQGPPENTVNVRNIQTSMARVADDGGRSGPAPDAAHTAKSTTDRFNRSTLPGTRLHALADRCFCPRLPGRTGHDHASAQARVAARTASVADVVVRSQDDQALHFYRDLVQGASSR